MPVLTVGSANSSGTRPVFYDDDEVGQTTPNGAFIPMPNRPLPPTLPQPVQDFFRNVQNFFDKYFKPPPQPASTGTGPRAGFSPIELFFPSAHAGEVPLVDNQCNTDYTNARGFTLPRDPLVLDLDGDGIETVGINPLAPILFDHDADGVKTGTGWIQSDDGLLVIDINGNGVIDSGRELFGDNSLLYTAWDGPVYAADGYAALRAQDSNHDGVVNSLDANFNQLRVWRDLNQDGISQAGELQTLSQAGIASIGVTGTATNTNLGNGNTQVASGSFTRSDGSTGQSGSAELTGSYLLAGNSRRCVISSCSRNILLGCRPKKHRKCNSLFC